MRGIECCPSASWGTVKGTRSAVVFSGVADPLQQHVAIYGLEVTWSSVLSSERKRMPEEKGCEVTGVLQMTSVCVFLSITPFAFEKLKTTK